MSKSLAYLSVERKTIIVAVILKWRYCRVCGKPKGLPYVNDAFPAGTAPDEKMACPGGGA